MKKILIIDFMYLWNRIYAVKGIGTGNHIYRSLQHVDETDYYDLKFAVLDGNNSTAYRRRLFPEYKENRSGKDIVYKKLGTFLENNATKFKTIRFIKNDNWEADDVITSIVRKYEDFDKYIYSGDTDLYQLLRFRNTHIGTKYSRGMIIEPVSISSALSSYESKYGLSVNDVSYIIKCKTFKGDSSDNIPIACPGMKTVIINELLETCWNDDIPLSLDIIKNMTKHMKDNHTWTEYKLFKDNRESLIRNYKLTQLGYIDRNMFNSLKTLQGGGIWE